MFGYPTRYVRPILPWMAPREALCGCGAPFTKRSPNKTRCGACQAAQDVKTRAKASAKLKARKCKEKEI